MIRTPRYSVLPALLLWVSLFLVVASSDRFSLATQSLNISLLALFLIGAIFPLLLFSRKAWLDEPCDGSESDTYYVLIRILGAAIPVVLFWVLFHQVLGGWWTIDDPNILHHADVVGIWQGFYEPESRYNFYTPLQIFSLGIDLFIAGFNPKFFYWHHLISLSLSLCLLYLLLSQFFSSGVSCMAVSLFVVTVPTSEMAHWLMLRHYVEGLLFGLCAMLLFSKSIREESWKWAVIGSFCYFIAALAKELYVPLVFVLLCLPVGRFITRAKFLVPFICFATLYTGLRFYMLREQILTGYAEQTVGWVDVVNLPQNILQAMGWSNVGQFLILATTVILIVIFLMRINNSARLCFLVWLGACFLVLIPVLWRIIEYSYYLYVFTLGFSVLSMIAGRQLIEIIPNRDLGALFVTSLFLLLLLTNLFPSVLKQQQLHDSMVLQKTQGEMLFANTSPDSVLLYDYHVAGDLIYFRDLENVTDHYDQEKIKWCPRSDCLCAQLFPGYVGLMFSDSQWQDVELAKQQCSASLAQLSATIAIQLPRTLSWQFEVSPPTSGTFSIASTIDQYGKHLTVPYVLPVPDSATVEFCCEPFQSTFSWVVHFKSSQGWELTSEPIVIDAGSVNQAGSAEFSFTTAR